MLKNLLIIAAAVFGIALCFLIPSMLQGYLQGWGLSLSSEIIRTAKDDVNNLTDDYVRSRLNAPLDAIAQVTYTAAAIQSAIIGVLCFLALNRKRESQR